MVFAFLMVIISILVSHSSLPLLRRCISICADLVSTIDIIYIEAEQEGCWSDVQAKLKIKIERCGCNAAFSITPSSALVLSSILALTWYLIQ